MNSRSEEPVPETEIGNLDDLRKSLVVLLIATRLWRAARPFADSVLAAEDIDSMEQGLETAWSFPETQSSRAELAAARDVVARIHDCVTEQVSWSGHFVRDAIECVSYAMSARVEAVGARKSGNVGAWFGHVVDGLEAAWSQVAEQGGPLTPRRPLSGHVDWDAHARKTWGPVWDTVRADIKAVNDAGGELDGAMLARIRCRADPFSLEL